MSIFAMPIHSNKDSAGRAKDLMTIIENKQAILHSRRRRQAPDFFDVFMAQSLPCPRARHRAQIKDARRHANFMHV